MSLFAAGRRLLIVDDLSFLRTTVTRLLNRAGFTDIVQAKDGVDALGILGGGSIDCVLTDYRMPGITGLQLLQQIRVGDLGSRRNLPVVLLTGHAERAVVEAAQALDANDVLVKPCSAKTLAQRLEHAIVTPAALKTAEEYRQVALPKGTGDSLESASREPRPAWVLRDAAKPFRTTTVPNDTLDAKAPTPTTVLPVNPKATPVAAPRLPSKPMLLAELKPGMVIAENVASPTGLTLLGEGTVLTDKIIERLHALGGDLHQVRIYY